MRGTESSVTRRAFGASLLSGCAFAQYVDRRKEPLSFDGPGEDPVAEHGLKEIPIGLFGPTDAAHATGGAMYMGLALALEDANAGGGAQGRKFALVNRWADDPWRGGASAVVKLAMVDHACAIFGGIDGATTHLAEQVVTKALLPLVDAVSTDQTVNGASVPWMFSWAPADPEIAEALVRAAGARFTLVAGTDHDSRNLAAEVMKAAAKRRAEIVKRMDVGAGVKELPQAVEGECCVLIAPAAETAALAGQAGLKVLAGPGARSRACQGLERIRSPRLHAGRPELGRRMEARFGQRADDFSYLAYDAAMVLVGAIREAGTHRARIRERLAPHFGPRGRRVQEVSL